MILEEKFFKVTIKMLYTIHKYNKITEKIIHFIKKFYFMEENY